MTTIAVGVDGSAGSKAALAWAIAQAERMPHGRVVAVSAWTPSVPSSGPWYESYMPADISAATRAELRAAIASARGEACRTDIEDCVVRGSAFGALMDAARTADVLVVGSRGLGGFKGLLLGSVSHQVVTYAPCPVVVVPASDSAPASRSDERRIVVGVDGSPNSTAALEWAARWASATGAPVRAIHAWQYPPMAVTAHPGVGPPPSEVPHDVAQQHLAALIAAADLPRDVVVEAHTREGLAAKVLLDEAATAGLVVVGARGHGGFLGLLLGSVSSAVVQHCTRPVAVIRAPKD